RRSSGLPYRTITNIFLDCTTTRRSRYRPTNPYMRRNRRTSLLPLPSPSHLADVLHHKFPFFSSAAEIARRASSQAPQSSFEAAAYELGIESRGIYEAA